ncbi:hypothetical protein HanPI659440_Chr00c05g0713411 [Helianthus annuus]|nr:hypothetical protein HanPI659440_Chr00c05g0713411 [Helianthus annuus]
MYRIPSFLGRRVQGCFYGWVILSNHPHNDMWSLWNPKTSKTIRLPRLIPKKGDRGSSSLRQCCLSSPPDDHGSIFMLTIKEYTIAFCRLDCKRKRLKWVEMSYAKQMKNITGGYDGFLHSLTCCNGKVYALNSVRSNGFVIQIDIVVKGTEVVISLLPYVEHHPSYYINDRLASVSFLKGCCTELFYIELSFVKEDHVETKTVGDVDVFKLDTTDIRWEKLEDLKDAAFFLDLTHGGYSAFYSPAIGSELGGYVHFLDRSGLVINSYDVKNKTIALSSMPTRHTSMLERRLQGDHGEIKFKQEEDSGNDEVDSKLRLVDIPLDVLKTIMELCFGVEYLNFRATCKKCQIAAPMIRWSKGEYSLVSPWLMVLDKERGVISFTDPMFGDKYYIKTPKELIGDMVIHCSLGGWVLIRRRTREGTREGSLMFYNPFTSDIRVLPPVPHLDTCSFSAPPTSSDCVVVGFTFTPRSRKWRVYVHFVAGESLWIGFDLSFCDDDLPSFHSGTQWHEYLYALYYDGGLGFVHTQPTIGTYVQISACFKGPRSSCRSPKQHFLMKCDDPFLVVLVIVGEFGECVEVFKLNGSYEWEKTESLGRDTIYICGKACLCIEAKTPEMANRIYFPCVRSENRKIVFYSLETRRYHTSDVEESFGDFMGTQHHLDQHVWIEPCWS